MAADAKRLEGILFNSLLLLGHTPSLLQKEYGVALADDLFGHANPGALNAIFHILFCSITGNGKKLLQGIWPIKQNNARDFHKEMHQLVSNLAKQEVIPKPVASSFLHAVRMSSGSRLMVLLCFLAHHALEKIYSSAVDMVQLQPKVTPIFENMEDAALSCLAAQLELEVTKYHAGLKEFANKQEIADSAQTRIATVLEANTTSIPAEQSSKENLLVGVSNCSSELRDMLVKERKATEAWNRLQAGFKQQLHVRDTLQTAVGSGSHPSQLSSHLEGVRDPEGAPLDLPSAIAQGHHQLKDFSRLLPDQRMTQTMRQRKQPASKLLSEEHRAALTDLIAQQISRLEAQRQLQSNIAALQMQVDARKAALRLKLTQQPAQRNLASFEPNSPMIGAIHPPLTPATEAHGIDSHRHNFLETDTSKKRPQVLTDKQYQNVDFLQPACPSMFLGSSQILRDHTSRAFIQLQATRRSTSQLQHSFLPEGYDTKGLKDMQQALTNHIQEHTVVMPLPSEPKQEAETPLGMTSKRLSFSAQALGCDGEDEESGTPQNNLNSMDDASFPLTPNLPSAEQTLSDIMARFQNLNRA